MKTKSKQKLDPATLRVIARRLRRADDRVCLKQNLWRAGEGAVAYDRLVGQREALHDVIKRLENEAARLERARKAAKP